MPDQRAGSDMTDSHTELSRERTPIRQSRRERRVTTSGFTWLRPDQVPGAVLSAETQRELQKKLREIDECQARARVSARNYVIYR